MQGLLKIDFPDKKPQIRSDNTKTELFDPIRKIWIMATPEEWVRQNFILLLLEKGYPGPLLAIEKKILVNDLTKRCDIVVYTRSMDPFMIVECKQMDVKLTEKVLNQILRYHITIQSQYLIITNGTYTMGFKKSGEQFVPIQSFPSFPTI